MFDVLKVSLVVVAGLATTPVAARAQEHRDLDLESLPSPMEALRNIQNTGRMVFMVADINQDGQISQKEAIDAGNLLVGGFFFRADGDGNGAVTQEEMKTAREGYLNQNPTLRYLVESIEPRQNQPRNSTQGNHPLQDFVVVVDTNADKQIQAAELRQMVQTITQTFFTMADTNRDGKMNPTEIYASIAGMGRDLARTAFQQADDDHNGQISRAEYDKALIEPANLLFQVIDLNHDGQASEQEFDRTGRMIVAQLGNLWKPEPPNAPTNLLESGKLPTEVAPVPTFTAPNGRQNRPQPGQPVPPANQPARR